MNDSCFRIFRLSRLLPSRQFLRVFIEFSEPFAPTDGPLLTLRLDCLPTLEEPAPAPLLCVLSASELVQESEGRWRADIPWPEGRACSPARLFKGVVASTFRTQDQVELTPALAHQLAHLWPADAEAVLTHFVHRAMRCGALDYQQWVAQALWQRHPDEAVRRPLALMLGYKKIDTAAAERVVEARLPDDVEQVLQRSWGDGCIALPSLELQRRAWRWHWALWQKGREAAEPLMAAAIVPVTDQQDPMTAAEPIMRTRLMRLMLCVLDEREQAAREEALALQRDLIAVTEHADPLRLLDFISHRKCFQLTSLGRRLMRSSLPARSQARMVLLQQALNATLNLGPKPMERISGLLGVEGGA